VATPRQLTVTVIKQTQAKHIAFVVESQANNIDLGDRVTDRFPRKQAMTYTPSRQ